jgi:hypothetical protein
MKTCEKDIGGLVAVEEISDSAIAIFQKLNGIVNIQSFRAAWCKVCTI